MCDGRHISDKVSGKNYIKSTKFRAGYNLRYILNNYHAKKIKKNAIFARAERSYILKQKQERTAILYV